MRCTRRRLIKTIEHGSRSRDSGLNRGSGAVN
jgi:hypothetical protein